MRTLVIEADGGSRGNPGPAGYGALIRDPADGRVLAEVAEAIGTATNNVAEYRGLIAGLEAATEIGGAAGSRGDTTLEVRMDSKLVVEQMSGRWKIKHPDLRPLARQAGKLAESFAAVDYRWVRREDNAHADRLANEAMDAAAAGRPWVRHRTDGPEAGQQGTEPAAPGAGEAPAREGMRAAEPEPARADPVGATEAASVQAASSAVRPEQKVRSTGWMAPSTSATAMVLLRHGETPLSGERRFSGIGDAHLTEAGEAQARAAARTMGLRGDIAAIVSSPLPRARRTAEIVAETLGIPVNEDTDLRETDFGAWEGLTFAEVRDHWPDALGTWLEDATAAPPGGESFAATAERVARARDALLRSHPARGVLVVSHVTPIKTLVRQALLAPPSALYRLHLDVGCVSEIDWYPDGPAVVRALNDTSHLT